MAESTVGRDFVFLFGVEMRRTLAEKGWHQGLLLMTDLQQSGWGGLLYVEELGIFQRY